MPDTFAIFYDGALFVTLTGFRGVLPEVHKVLDYYAREYGLDRKHLSGTYVQSISVADMKYEDFA